MSFFTVDVNFGEHWKLYSILLLYMCKDLTIVARFTTQELIARKGQNL